jgi:hypothetical protein
MAIDKSTWNKKQKVTQHTIDSIKRLGMTKALDLAKMNSKAYQAGLVAEYQEATRRLYGDRRFTAATGVAAPKKVTNKKTKTTSGGGKYVGSMFVPDKPSKPSNPKQADKASTKYSPTPYKAPAKKKNDNTALKVAGTVAGTVAAAGLLIASRGRAAGVATRLAPGLMKNKVAQTLLLGEVKQAPKVVSKVVSKASTKASTASLKAKEAAAVARGRAAAAAGKPVSQSQYDAMLAAAKARGISTAGKKAATTAATKATATATKKAAAKKAAAAAAAKAKAAAAKLAARGNARWDK